MACQSRLIVNYACGISKSHNLLEKLCAIPSSMEIKCAFKVRLEHSAVFLQMDTGWHQLIFHSPFRIDDAIIFSTCFIIQNVRVHQHMMVLDTLHDGVVVCQSVFVSARLEGSDNDSIGIKMIHNYYILLATARAYMKASSIISI